MNNTIYKQISIIIASLVLSGAIIFVLYDNVSTTEQMVPDLGSNIVSQPPIVTGTEKEDASKTAIAGTIISKESNQLLVRLQLQNEEKDVTVLITEETILTKRSFENGQVKDTKTSLAEVLEGAEVNLLVYTGDVSVLDQATIIPLELIFRG